MYCSVASVICLLLLMHVVCLAFSRAWAKTEKRIAARMAIMAITTSSSMSVKPARRLRKPITILLGKKKKMAAKIGRGSTPSAAGMSSAMIVSQTAGRYFSIIAFLQNCDYQGFGSQKKLGPVVGPMGGSNSHALCRSAQRR